MRLSRREKIVAVPSKKSKGVEKLINGTLPAGRTRCGSIEQNICSSCGRPATDFRDKLSCREYTISGFCQICQDKTFGGTDSGKVKVITLERPDWGYCVMKCLRELNDKKYPHLPNYATAEEHGVGNPVDLRRHNGDLICQIPWEEFKYVYTID